MRAVKAMPTLLRIGVAETVAYRGEFLIWMLTTTMPLVMLGLFTSVAKTGNFKAYSSADFVAYYLAVLIVRNLTGSWVAWQISEEIRMGTMSMRLLRPIHPFTAIAASHIAAIPFRAVISLPVAVIMLATSGAQSLTSDPLQLAMLLPSLALAWLISFAFLYALGCLAFFVTKAMALMNLYFLLFSLLSGYLLPIPLLPHWLRVVSEYSPFRFMLSVPVELMTKTLTTTEVLVLMAAQAGWAVAILGLALGLWRAGVKKFEAVGN